MEAFVPLRKRNERLHPDPLLVDRFARVYGDILDSDVRESLFHCEFLKVLENLLLVCNGPVVTDLDTGFVDVGEHVGQEGAVQGPSRRLVNVVKIDIRIKDMEDIFGDWHVDLLEEVLADTCSVEVTEGIRVMGVDLFSLQIVDQHVYYFEVWMVLTFLTIPFNTSYCHWRLQVRTFSKPRS